MGTAVPMEPAGDNQRPGSSLGPGFGAQVRRWRLRLPGRPSQEELARRANMSTAWYGKLERLEFGADATHFSVELMERVSDALELNATERELLFQGVRGHAPPVRPGIDAPESFELEPGRRIDVLSRPNPAYISDPSWDLVIANDAMRIWFPWIGEQLDQGLRPNVMMWTFTEPDARIQLHDWHNVWAPMMLAQMRAALNRQRNCPRLQRLISTIIDAEPYAKQLWCEWEQSYIQPDNSRRSLRLPFYDNQPIHVQLQADEPMGAPNARILSLIPLDDNDRRRLYQALRDQGSSAILDSAQ